MEIPKDHWPESTLALLADPYRFISRRCRRLGADVFEARLSMHRTLCLTGPEAAEVFYDESRFARAGVAPPWLRKTLFGEGGVQGLDDAAHRHRKAMFMSLMTPDRIDALAAHTAAVWSASARRWERMDKVVLYDELHRLLAQSVSQWAGVLIPEPEFGEWTRELTAMFDQAAGPGHLWARRARRRAERRMEALIHDIRSGRYPMDDQAVAAVIAWHRDPGGQLLDRGIAAVELINVLRPTVAVSVYVVFVALALHEHPDCRDRLRSGDAEYAEAFVQEVRRFFPFFPAALARVRRTLEWKGYRFPEGHRAMLDLYGINHDPRAWDRPDVFRPERFIGSEPDPYSFVPQGGATAQFHHRCPGEGIAVAIMKVAARSLARLDYEVADQNLRIRWTRLPALPRSRFVIRNVRVP